MRQFGIVILIFGLILTSCQLTSNLSQVGIYSEGYDIDDLVIHNNQAYLTGRLDGQLIILDFSNPVKPTQVGVLRLSEPVGGLAIEGNYAYVALQDSGLAVVDISDPANPNVVGTYQTESDRSTGVTILGIVVVGNYAYLATFADNLIIVDISDPTRPIERSRFTEINTPYPRSDINWIGEVGGYLYLSVPAKDTLTDRMLILDISNHISPTIIGEYDHPLGIEDMVVKDDLAYVVDGESLSILDISKPVTPSLLGKYRTRDIPVGVAINGDYAFVADLTTLRVIDVSNPVELFEVDSYQSRQVQIRDVVESNGFIFTLDDNDELPGQQLRIFEFFSP